MEQGQSREALLQKAAGYWSTQAGGARKRLVWGDFPLIKQHIAKRICGEERPTIVAALMERLRVLYGLAAPFEHGVSVGCGLGRKEIGIAKAGHVQHWDCFEISERRVSQAREIAESQDVIDRISFRCEDAFAANCPKYDLVFWSDALHHMLDVRQAIRWSIEHLKPGGVLAIDEFVGPNRFQWTVEMLDLATKVRESLDPRFFVSPDDPKKMFPRRVTRPSASKVAEQDPTESVDSESILPILRSEVPMVNLVHLGGVVYHIALSGLLSNFGAGDMDLLKSLLLLDGILADAGQSVFAVATYRKSPLA
jgi:SAM-dependent methyltransferase